MSRRDVARSQGCGLSQSGRSRQRAGTKLKEEGAVPRRDWEHVHNRTFIPSRGGVMPRGDTAIYSEGMSTPPGRSLQREHTGTFPEDFTPLMRQRKTTTQETPRQPRRGSRTSPRFPMSSDRFSTYLLRGEGAAASVGPNHHHLPHP